MILNQEQLNVALHQLASFRDLLEAMQRHLEGTEPSLIPTVSESYQQRIRELQEEICDYLLRERAEGTGTVETPPAERDPASNTVSSPALS